MEPHATALQRLDPETRQRICAAAAAVAAAAPLFTDAQRARLRLLWNPPTAARPRRAA